MTWLEALFALTTLLAGGAWYGERLLRRSWREDYFAMLEQRNALSERVCSLQADSRAWFSRYLDATREEGE